MLVMVGSFYIVPQEMLGVNHVLTKIKSTTQIVDSVSPPVIHLAPVIVSQNICHYCMNLLKRRKGFCHKML